MTSVVDTSVKFYRDDFPGAPVVTGTAGTRASAFSAMLTDGFGERTAVSLVVAGGIATVTLASDVKNPNLLDSVTLVAGSSITALNGEQKIIAADDTTLQFATAAADGTATGTITIKTAPVGWPKVYTDTNRAVWQIPSAGGTGFFMALNDTGVHPIVRGYETMSSAIAGTGPFPTTAQQSIDGVYWGASSSGAGSTAIRWCAFADSHILHWIPTIGTVSGASAVMQVLHSFGDIVPFKTTDAYHCYLSGRGTTGGVTTSSGSALVTGDSNLGGYYTARNYSGLGSSFVVYPNPFAHSNSGRVSGRDVTMGNFPTPTDGALRLLDIYINEGGTSGTSVTALRGKLPGVYFVPQNQLWDFFAPADRVTGPGGHKMYTLTPGTTHTDTVLATGRAFIDITGPWR